MLGMNGIWCKLEKSSFKLQKRIYRASQCNDIKKMHNLQRLLLKYNAPICLDHFFQSDPIFKMNMLINTSTHI
ncbi:MULTISPECIES: reverse transcriptase N-terminal domain-containing protein [unclassified Wolbachia]|uniref:reverse transcriptase N-terminal domain-containing protein n=1 Tax=unclassified Wolbachia TaxID=2640676 RepID=UPI00222E310E|nr:reverse transcriptase N-terminal domain-containing protein [Wolbachia endosymbiont (group B) of Chorthippus parallelus]